MRVDTTKFLSDIIEAAELISRTFETYLGISPMITTVIYSPGVSSLDLIRSGITYPTCQIKQPITRQPYLIAEIGNVSVFDAAIDPGIIEAYKDVTHPVALVAAGTKEVDYRQAGKKARSLTRLSPGVVWIDTFGHFTTPDKATACLIRVDADTPTSKDREPKT